MNIKTANSAAAVFVQVDTPLWYDEDANEIRIDDTNPNAPELYRLVKRVFADVRTPLDEDTNAKAALDRIRELVGDNAGDYAAASVEEAREIERRKTLKADVEKAMTELVDKYKDVSDADSFNEDKFYALYVILRERFGNTPGIGYRTGLLSYLCGYEAGKAATP